MPKTPKQIKRFLGLIGNYRNFIKDLAKLTKPFTKRPKKDTRMNIDDPEYKEAFKLCKTLSTNEPILQYPDFSKPFNLTSDASNYALGAVISQAQ